jgi:hypothetical protein
MQTISGQVSWFALSAFDRSITLDNERLHTEVFTW